MANKRLKIHPEYFRIKGYQIIHNISDYEMAEKLSCSVRTYRDKVNGWNEFSALQARRVSEILGVDQDTLFFTINVPKSEQNKTG